MRKVAGALLVLVFLLGMTVRSSLSQETIFNFDRYVPPGGFVPDSLEKLTDNADFIADAYVQSVFPSQNVGVGRLETDSLLRVNRVLKGSRSTAQIVVSQMGGVLGDRKSTSAQIRPMQVGEHYIVFLDGKITPDRIAGLPARPGIPRYDIFWSNVGLFLVDGDKLQLSSGVPLTIKTKYDGVNPTKVLLDIEAHLGSAQRQ